MEARSGLFQNPEPGVSSQENKLNGSLVMCLGICFDGVLLLGSPPIGFNSCLVSVPIDFILRNTLGKLDEPFI